MRTIATAGHVDHGKSTLVRALTGTDPDRLAEERARGLTIDLGFAFADLPSGRQIGFVDVPGHERFLPNMLAGAGAVDVALFVVAADEGWRAQSREHLEILDLLGVAGGVIAITKADRADADRLREVTDDVRVHIRGSVLDGASIIACDSARGTGIENLRVALDELLDVVGPPVDRGRPRLWVDRVFSVKGAGTVVTGTLGGGQLGAGQAVSVIGGGTRPARIRGLESGGAPVDVAAPGARVAVNLVGVTRSDVARGDVVVVEAQWRPTAVVDGRVHLRGPQPSGHTVLHAHVGSAKRLARIRIVDGFGRVHLDRALPLAPGDRLILRDPGPRAVVGSVEVIAVGPRQRFVTDHLRAPVLEQPFLARAWRRRDEIGPLTGLDERTLDEHLGRLVDQGVITEVGGWFVRTGEYERAKAALVGAVAGKPRQLEHAAATIGLSREQLKALASRLDEVALERNVIRHLGAPDAAATPDGRAVVDRLRSAPFSPPDPRGFVDDPDVLPALVHEGVVTKCGEIWFATDALTRAAELVATALDTAPQLTVSELRDLLGSTRKYTLAIAGWLDDIGVTRRQGDHRVRGTGRVPAR